MLPINKGKRKEVPTTTGPVSVVSYIKNHASFSEFRTYEFLSILNCDGPEEAKIETEQQLNNILSFPNINSATKSFIGSLLTNNLQFLYDNNAKMYWREKENIENLRLNAHEQFGIFTSIATETTRKASIIF